MCVVEEWECWIREGRKEGTVGVEGFSRKISLCHDEDFRSLVYSTSVDPSG